MLVPSLLDDNNGENDNACDTLEYLNLNSETFFRDSLPTSIKQNEVSDNIGQKIKHSYSPFLRIYYSVTYSSLILYLLHCLGLESSEKFVLGKVWKESFAVSIKLFSQSANRIIVAWHSAASDDQNSRSVRPLFRRRGKIPRNFLQT